MRILVLGGNGFIGSHVVDELLDAGQQVRVFDRAMHEHASWDHRVEVVKAEFRDGFALAEALWDMDLVFHLISTTLPATSNLEPVNDVQTNLVPTIQLLQRMLDTGVMRIVFLSSGGTVYGNAKSVPIAESQPLNPICSYGVVKVACENYIRMFAELHGIRPIILRPSNPFGPRQAHLGVQGVVPTFTTQILSGRPITVWGDGEVRRDFIYVRDLAKLCRLAAEKDVTGCFNVGYGESKAINEVIREIELATGRSASINYVSSRSFDPDDVVLDITKARKTFSWAPRTSFSEGIRKLVDWLSQQESPPRVVLPAT